MIEEKYLILLTDPKTPRELKLIIKTLLEIQEELNMKGKR
jgi:hypothetical protein